MEEIMDFPMRKYNYRLKTGTVGTNDGNIAEILYAINQMEMYVPVTTDDLDKINTTYQQIFFLTMKSRANLKAFQDNFVNKLDAKLFDEVVKTLGDLLCEIRAIGETLNGEKPDEDNIFRMVTKIPNDLFYGIEANNDTLNGEKHDTDNLCKVLSTIHEKILDIVPKILMLDDQSVGRV
jgi:hypothetical protein